MGRAERGTSVPARRIVPGPRPAAPIA